MGSNLQINNGINKINKNNTYLCRKMMNIKNLFILLTGYNEKNELYIIPFLYLSHTVCTTV